MNKKIKLAYLAIALSVLSFSGVLLGADMSAFVIFALGCLTFSYIALQFFKRGGVEGSSKAFLGGFIAMLIFLLIHVLFLVITLTFRDSDNWKWGWQFFVTLFGIIPAIGIGAIIGGIFDLFIKKNSGNDTISKKKIISKGMISWVAGLSLVAGFVLASVPVMVGNDKLSDLLSVTGAYIAIGYSIPFAIFGMLIATVINIVRDKKSNS